jgi:mRNA-degrading endonuclease RelE of RelBE toxin-antitoxin system
MKEKIHLCYHPKISEIENELSLTIDHPLRKQLPKLKEKMQDQFKIRINQKYRIVYSIDRSARTVFLLSLDHTIQKRLDHKRLNHTIKKKTRPQKTQPHY